MASRTVVWSQSDDRPLSPALDRLIASSVFSRQFQLSSNCAEYDRYWCDIVKALPADTDQALVLPDRVAVTEDILRLAAMLDARTVAVMPLSLCHEIARPFMTKSESLRLSTEDMNHWLNRYAMGKCLELPTLAGFCGWINVGLLRSIVADTDLVLAESSRKRGLSILLSDEAFVDDSACEASISVKGVLPRSLSEPLLDRHPYTALRHPLSQLNAQEKTPPALLSRGPGVILHISHSWGGGLGRWISDFCAAEDEHLHLVLKSVGSREAAAQALALHLGTAQVPLKQWTLSTPIQSTSLGSFEYREILTEIKNAFAVRGVIVSTLIGHSVDIYDIDAPMIQVLHDYYPWCPPLYATWSNPCDTCDSERLGRCLKENPSHQFFGDETWDWYVALREQFLKKVISRNLAVVAPSLSVKKRWQQLAPSLRDYPVTVIGHGLPEWELDAFAGHRWESPPGKRLHLVVLGVLSEHKGVETLQKLLPQLLEQYRVTLLGTGPDAPTFQKHPRLTVEKWYQLPDLPAKLKGLEPDLALLLSTVPETFSYTLSEVFAAGIPPVATRLGAFEDRIEDGVNGWLVSPSGDDLLSTLARLAGDRGAIASVRARLLATEQRSNYGMVRDYLKLIPVGDEISVRRPLCRSVVADLGVSLEEGEPSQKALFVRPGAAYRLALFQFLSYSHQKIQSSPKVSRVTRALLSAVLRIAMRLARP